MKSSTAFILCIISCLTSASPLWNSEPLQTCPSIGPQKDLLLEQVVGDWRLAYIFLGQVDEGLDEDNTCVVVALTPTNDTQLELSLFIDTQRGPHQVDRSTVQFPVDLISPGDWKVHTPLSSEGYLHARIIRASDEHLVITFCGPNQERSIDNEIDGARPGTSAEEPLNWRSLFERPLRRKRSSHHFSNSPEAHMWTAVLVKHNNVSALKFVEYATVLMKHGYDVTQGELVSFGKCPVSYTNHKEIL